MIGVFREKGRDWREGREGRRAKIGGEGKRRGDKDGGGE